MEIPKIDQLEDQIEKLKTWKEKNLELERKRET